MSELWSRATIIRRRSAMRLVEDHPDEVEPVELGEQLDLELDATRARPGDHVDDDADRDVGRRQARPAAGGVDGVAGFDLDRRRRSRR